MASGSFNLTKSSNNSSGSYIIGKIEWKSTPNTAGNYSSMQCTLYCKKANASIPLTEATTGTWAYSVTINEKNFTGSVSTSVLTDWVAIASVQVSKISHDTDGGKTITVKGSVSAPSETSFAGLTTSGSKSVTLDTLQRTSSVSATNANIGSKTTISIKRASSSFTHTLTYRFGSLVGTIATKTTSTSVSWTVPTTFYENIPNAKSGYCIISCATYSGSTLIGTSTCTFTATADKSSCAPSVSVTAEDTNTAIIALTGSNKKIVKGFSTVKATATATAENSASISSVTIACGSVKKTGTSVTFSGAESATVKATATDSRGYSSAVSASGLTLINYLIPSVTSCTITRTTPTSDTVNIVVKGKWYNGSFGTATNSLAVEYRYKPKSQSGYTDDNPYHDFTVTTSGNSYTAKATITGLPYTQAYSLRIRASDVICEYGGINDPTYKNTEIKKGIPVFDWGENDFQFNVPVAFPENLYNVSGTFGINMNNSDIINLNAIYCSDEAAGPKEGINFYRDGTNWDAIWASGGNIFFCPNYPANETNYALFYAAGDTISLSSQSASFSGFLTDSAKRLTFTIPLSKPIIASGATISGSVVGRGIGGYIVASSADAATIDLSGGDGYAVDISISDVGINVKVQFAEAIPLATNNTAIAVTPYGTVAITFS